MVPDDDQAIVLPWASVIVIIVLLNDAFTWATPEAMFLRSRRRTRVASLPIIDPFAARSRKPHLRIAPCGLLLLAGDRLRRPLAGARIGGGALAADRKASPMPQPTVAAEIHQPLDIDGGLAPQVAFDHIVTIDNFANLQHFLVGQLCDPAFVGNPDLCHDFAGLRGPDAVNVLKADKHALIGWYIDASDTGQDRTPLSSVHVYSRIGPNPVLATII